MIELSNEVIVTDPCYTVGTWCTEKLTNVLSGKYHCYYNSEETEDWGYRVTAIKIVHQNYNDSNSAGYDFQWEEINQEIGVDSGQCGIFDFDYYDREKKTEEAIKADDSLKWDPFDPSYLYGKCCRATIGEYNSEKCKSIENKGVVASSGYGDGTYTLYVAKNLDDKVFALKLVFIETEKDNYVEI